MQMTSPSTQQELLPFLQAAGQSDWPPLMTLSRGAQETLLSNGVCAIPLEKIYSQASWTPAVVRRKFETLAGFSLLLALLALFISFSIHCSWMLQGQTMVSQQVLPASHHRAALEASRYIAKNLIELQKFRDPIGWKMAFVGDSLLSGFLLTRVMKGQKRELKAEAIQEMKEKVQKETETVDREVLATARWTWCVWLMWMWSPRTQSLCCSRRFDQQLP